MSGLLSKRLWFERKVYLLKQPSIHRINPKGHYIEANCCFLEWSEHKYMGLKEHAKRRKRDKFGRFL